MRTEFSALLACIYPLLDRELSCNRRTKSHSTMVLFLLSAVASLNPAAAMRTDAALRRPAVSPAGAAMSRAGLIVAKDKPKKEKAAKEEAPKEEKAAPAPAPAAAPPLQAPAPDGFEWGKTY